MLSPQVDRQVERLRLWLGLYGDGPAGGAIRQPMRFHKTGQDPTRPADPFQRCTPSAGHSRSTA